MKLILNVLFASAFVLAPGLSFAESKMADHSSHAGHDADCCDQKDCCKHCDHKDGKHACCEDKAKAKDCCKDCDSPKCKKACKSGKCKDGVCPPKRPAKDKK